MAEYIKISDHSDNLSLSNSCLKQPGQHLEIAILPRPLVALVINVWNLSLYILHRLRIKLPGLLSLMV